MKLNKEAPLRKDVFRAPGHQGNMKKLIHFLQTGRLVNMDNFSVYTIASVLKKFLRKIPGGVFGREGEQQLFTVIRLDSMEQQRDQIHKYVVCLLLMDINVYSHSRIVNLQNILHTFIAILIFHSDNQLIVIAIGPDIKIIMRFYRCQIFIMIHFVAILL